MNWMIARHNESVRFQVGLLLNAELKSGEANAKRQERKN